ncbi:hypothetical protein D3C87_2133590 [compost metagenome]
MRRFAMDRHEDFRAGPLVHFQKLVAAWVAGYVNERLGVSDDVDALFDQAVHDFQDRLFVAGNGA